MGNKQKQLDLFDDQMQAMFGGKYAEGGSASSRLEELQRFVEEAKQMDTPKQESLLKSIFGGSERKTASEKVDEIFKKQMEDRPTTADIAYPPPIAFA